MSQVSSSAWADRVNVANRTNMTKKDFIRFTSKFDISRGLDSAIIDPTDKQLYALKAGLMLAGKDEFCMEYITAFREGGLG
jgi:hypothetical protein